MKTVCIDPGHGGHDPGTGTVGKIRESDVALDYALALRSALERAGVAVVLTRERDEGLTIGERARFANANDADLFLSVHCNAGPANAWGFQPIHAKTSAKGRAAAEAILEAVTAAGVPKGPRTRIVADQTADTGYTSAARGYFEGLSSSLSWGERDRLTRERYGEKTYRTLGVLRQTAMPAVLLELGFLTNTQERERLLSERGKAQLVEGITNGVLEWLGIAPAVPRVQPSVAPGHIPPDIRRIPRPTPEHVAEVIRLRGVAADNAQPGLEVAEVLLRAMADGVEAGAREAVKRAADALADWIKTRAA